MLFRSVGDPKVLILDEPTEGIQPSIIKDIERVIRLLAQRGDMAIVLVEQYFEFAKNLADRFLVLERGRVVAEAESARAALQRRLDLDLHEAEHGLLVLDGSVALAEQRRELADRQWRMAQSGFAQGEIELRDLLRIQEIDRNAVRDAERLAIERRRTIAAFNQALGELP